MKTATSFAIFAFWTILLFSPCALQADQKSLMAELENVDAVQAVAIANKWRWTNRNITISVDDWKIIFKFPNGQVKTVPMPADKMLVAVAPYIRKTHA
ncbi:MAG: hypothetical protein P1P89_21155 [Desulfobacterales bacterium]|nr:hypothetical protein [Desulfobacterales bacterium]